MTSVALGKVHFTRRGRKASAKRGLVVKWLSRLPVTEEIAGSSPVGPAILPMLKKPLLIARLFATIRLWQINHTTSTKRLEL
jgi:hypothetical protein